MTRLWSQGQLIVVMNDEHEKPYSFVWREQTHQIVEITRQWRVDIGWWRKRSWRTYYKLSTDTGLLAIIYRDLEANEWYLQRLYD